MKKLAPIFSILAAFLVLCGFQIVNSGYRDIPEISAPSNPAAGFHRVYANSSTHQFSCLTSSGSSCSPSGSSLPTIGTANQVLGVVNAGGSLEYKTITAGANITVTHAANSITIAGTGGGGGGSYSAGDGLTLTGSTFAADTTVPSRLSGTATLDFPSITGGGAACAELTISVPGAATTDEVSLGPPAALEAGTQGVGIVTAAGVVTVRLCKQTSGSVDPASAQWRATINRGR